jgi:hypothetical protein
MIPYELFWLPFGGTAAALAVAKVLSETLLKHWFKKDFKHFERKLDDISKRQEIQFSKLHEERARVIKEYYTKLIALGRRFDSAHISLLFGDKEKQQQVCTEVLTFADFHEDNQIYFDETTAKKIAIIISQFLNLHTITTVDIMDAEIGEIRGDIAELISLLRDDFRVMLGVENKTASPG